MSDMSKHEKLESFFDEYGDEICKVCPWQKESHHPEILCEGRYCEEAADEFAETLEAKKGGA